MNSAFQTVANRYAKAFLAVFGKNISFDDFENIQLAHDYLNRHKKELYFLRLPMLSKEQKVTVLEKIVTKLFNLPDFFKKLYILLVQDKREQFIGIIFQSLCQLYQKQHNIESFIIESSTELSSLELKKIKLFLARATGADIIYKYRVNPTLLAGLRMQSNTNYWEYSIKQQLQTIKQELTQ